jgi:hypothetical protein
MTCNTFARGALFAAVAAAAWLPWALVMSPIVGAWNAHALFLVGITVAYVAAMASGTNRFGAAIAVTLAGVLGAWLLRTPGDLVVALAVTIAVVRSGVLYPAPHARAVLRETALVFGGLALARFLAGSTLLSIGLALWGFFLVQSLFFLFAVAPGGVGVQSDPFEEAHRRALALLDRTSV